MIAIKGDPEANEMTPARTKKPNVVYSPVDNLGMGELSSYTGGSVREVPGENENPGEGKRISANLQ
jgi:hypothetical protein